jgi:hypothetical protein
MHKNIIPYNMMSKIFKSISYCYKFFFSDCVIHLCTKNVFSYEIDGIRLIIFILSQNFPYFFIYGISMDVERMSPIGTLKNRSCNESFLDNLKCFLTL